MIKNHGSKGYIINLSFAKNTVIKSAVNKGNRYKHALREIAVRKSTTLKLLEINFFFSVSYVFVFNIKKIFRHLGVLNSGLIGVKLQQRNKLSTAKL
jgi:hypothetical protein